jgi:glycine/D-amino acid oxidase-like deaminating enzyme
MNTSEILVVGAGIFGASAALELRLRGHSVTLMDPGPLPHPEASSTDVSKIVRADYGGDAFYTRFAHACMPEWHRWNSKAGQAFYHETGFLVLAEKEMRPGGFEHDSHEVMRSLGQDVERLDEDRLRRRFPAWTPGRYTDGYFNPHAGWVESGNVVAWLLTLAREAGVVLREGEKMEALLEDGTRVTGIVTERGVEHRSEIVVVATGAWTPTLLPWMGEAFRCVGQPVYHIKPADPEPYRPDRFPPWAADIAKTGWYGFPAQPDGTVKLANHGAGFPVDPRGEKIVPAEVDQKFSDFLASSLPGLAGSQIVLRRLCLYCDSWDGDFWIDWDPNHEGLLVATGGSGHGFKFAPLIGAVIADKIEGKANPWEFRFRWRTPGDRRTEAARMG